MVYVDIYDYVFVIYGGKVVYMTELAICVPLIRTDYIKRYLETLYANTPEEFRVFVCDQSVEGMDKELIKKYVHWYVRPYHNLGFAKATNELMWTAYRQGYPYIAACNDDVEYMHPKWFQGIKDQFAEDEKIMAVSPESPRVPLWGYGRNHEEYIDIVPHKEKYTDEDWKYLCKGDYENLLERFEREPEDLPFAEDGKKDWGGKIYIPKTFPLIKRGVVDGNAAWHPVFKREAFEKVGYFDERFMYGGGEDYDYNARVYRQRYRYVGTMKSWVWHWWGKSKDQVAKLPPELFDRPFWNNNDELWPKELNFGQSVDPWGHSTNPQTGEKVPFKRVPEVRIDPL